MDDRESTSHEHSSRRKLPFRLGEFFHAHQHDLAAASMDTALSTGKGIRAVKLSFAALMLTGVIQLAVVYLSGSVALMADTIHNFSDALTALPLWFAFSLSRRPRNQRFTYGYGRAEDLAGLVIVIMIFASAVLIFYESIRKIMDPQPVSQIAWVMAAAITGFVGNELVALYRVRVGRQIGSAALVADGMHARTDGLTSLGVLIGTIGVWLNFPLADPIVGVVIGLIILGVAWRSAREIWARMMDAADPELVTRIETTSLAVEGVLAVSNIRIRWLGHRQLSELNITVNCQLPTYASHRIAEEVRHAMLHELPRLLEVIVHVDPCECALQTSPAHVDHHAQENSLFESHPSISREE